MSAPIPTFEERLEHALGSESIAIALDRAMPTFRAKRLEAFKDDDFRTVQKRLHRIKADAIERLPDLVRQFREEAGKVGAMVHMAETVGQARQIVGDIARRHEAKLVVKSKSMVSEEVGINEYLEAMGVRAVETDLGEYIVQLGKDRPSHLIAPAIHWTREQVAELFSRELSREVPADVAELVKVARERLRQDFVDADIGITGANIMVANTGTVVLVSNEGNARLVSTLPPVHIVIAGPEKIVPSLDEANEILKVLARNATGQKMSSYVSFITGPSRTADIELTLAIGVHGPKEMHIILLDNGRWSAREDPDFREALHCIKCGACANVCPPYQVVGGHAFGYVYTGPIGLVLTAMHDGLDQAGGPQGLCASCNTCETVCPVGIPIPRQIIDVRQRYVEKKGMPLKKRAVIAGLTNERLQGLARLAQGPFVSEGGLIRSLPLAAGLTSWRSLPGLAQEPLRKRLAHLVADGATGRRGDAERISIPTSVIPGSRAVGLKVAYFPGCLTDRLGPKTGEAVVKVLQALGCEVSLPVGWSCCGLVANNAGDRQGAVTLARETLSALERVQADHLVSSSTSCMTMMVQDYLHLFRYEPEWRARAEALAARIIDFTRFVDSMAQLPAGALAHDGEVSATYHDPCQSNNCLGLRDEARRILREVMGVELREMVESTVCCGFGGSFSLEHPRVARRILARKLANAFATGAEVIVADNPGCLMHLGGGVDKSGKSVRVMHLAELMAERVQGMRQQRFATGDGERD